MGCVTEKKQKVTRRGAGDRDRTGDIQLGRLKLYRLSYTRDGRSREPAPRTRRKKKRRNVRKRNGEEGDGFEPSKAVPADLQSAPFGHSGNPPKLLTILTPFEGRRYRCNVELSRIAEAELARGVEPLTAGLQNRCSAN